MLAVDLTRKTDQIGGAARRDLKKKAVVCVPGAPCQSHLLPCSFPFFLAYLEGGGEEWIRILIEKDENSRGVIEVLSYQIEG